MPKLIIERQTVENIVYRLTGSEGLGGTDSTCLRRMMSNYGKTSRHLQEKIVKMTEWMVNTLALWAVYREMMAGRLVALDKHPGVRPVCIGESWCRMMSKVVLQLTRNEAAKACGTSQLCAGLPAGIEGGIHAATDLVREHEEEEEWGFLLVDASNAFNAMSRERMFWSARY